MKELEFLKVINKKINSDILGDDCALIKESNIVITQDNFVENVHFKREWATPYQIGYKAAAVNISDILASGAKPAYLTVGLTLPKDIDISFISELYGGIKAGAYGADIIGGDITGGNSIFISITAIGKTQNRKISSRKNAKIGYTVIASSEHGKSSQGYKELLNGGNNTDLISAHLEPQLDVQFSEDISTQIDTEYAMIDTSDGLADALFKIARSSNVKIVVNNSKGIWGAEDYKLVAAVPKEFLSKISNYIEIGAVEPFDGAYLKIDKKNYSNYDELGLYDHFGE